MKLIRTIFVYYLLSFLVGCASIWFFHSNKAVAGIFTGPVFWLGPLIFILAGLAVRGILLVFTRPKNINRFLAFASLTAAILYCLLMVWVQVQAWYPAKYTANITANEDFLDNDGTYPREEKRAFTILTDQYKNPNDLRLVQTTVTRYDSMIDNAKIDIYEIEFVYFRRYQKGRYKSKCTIAGNHALLHYFDRPLDEAEEYKMDSSSNIGRMNALTLMLADSAKFSLDSSAKATIRKALQSDQMLVDTPAVN